MDTITTAGLLRVPDAVIHNEVRCAGPLLLIFQSGEGDAGRSTDLVDQLAPEYTVVTYDRRGLSRSKLEHNAGGANMAEHADDGNTTHPRAYADALRSAFRSA